MLVTSLCWWLYDDGRSNILPAKSICWRNYFLVMLMTFSCKNTAAWYRLHPISVTNISFVRMSFLFSLSIASFSHFSRLEMRNSSFFQLLIIRLKLFQSSRRFIEIHSNNLMSWTALISLNYPSLNCWQVAYFVPITLV